jgi:hydrogenase maturation factor
MTTPDCTPGPDGACALCGDVAHPATVLAVDAAARMAAVELGGARVEVATDLVGRVRAGETLLVHQGFAIGRLEAP